MKVNCYICCYLIFIKIIIINFSGSNNKEQSLQDALSETSNYITETISSSRTEPFVNMRHHTVKMQDKFKNTHINEISDVELAQKWKISGQNFEPTTYATYEDDFYKKSSRSCKGKRYQEIMKSIAKNGSPNKRLKVKHPNSTANVKENGYSNKTHERNIDGDGKEGPSTDNQKDMNDKSKMFDASDFDLEEKIKALPALSLDDYLARKRETKKTKKKIGGMYRSKLNLIIS